MSKDIILNKTKVILNKEKTQISIFIWEKTFLWFGKWHKCYSTDKYNKLKTSKINLINDENVTRVLYKNFLIK